MASNQFKKNISVATKEKESAKGNESPAAAERQPSPTLGDYSSQIISKQFRRIVKQEDAVLADKHPEALHQMRVGTRRLRTALQIFDAAIKIPDVANAKRLRNLARVLGDVRDLDVQMASLRDEYQSHVGEQEQRSIDKVLDSLESQRKDAFAKLKATFNHSSYQDLKAAYKKWNKSPKFTSIAQLPLAALLPDILSPLLSKLLMHPGWLIPLDQTSGKNSEVIHDLRKECKHVRYQAEFFTPFYGNQFNEWIEEVKALQDQLGMFQDVQVLQTLLVKELNRNSRLPELHGLVEEKQAESLANWEETRQKYLDNEYRYSLHQMLLQPTGQFESDNDE